MSEKRLPFHESVLLAIDTASSEQLEFLGGLLKRTTIPKGHDEIVAAWAKRRVELGWSKDKSLGVRTSLLEDKQVRTPVPPSTQKELVDTGPVTQT